MLVDDDGGSLTPVLAAWQRYKREPLIGAYLAKDPEAIASDAVRSGRLAMDVLDHVVDTRLQVFEFVDVDHDGTVAARVIDRLPWRLWMRTEDVGEGHLARLRDRLGIVQI